MLGAIAGDVIGSVYEFNPLQTAWDDFPLFSVKSAFTDDTVMTIAVADSLMGAGGGTDLPAALVQNFHKYGSQYPHAGYGGRFGAWLSRHDTEPYNSFGNGSAMRVAPVGWAFDTLEEVEKVAAVTAAVTHNHPEGIKGARAVAGAIYLARAGKDQTEIKNYISVQYGYDLTKPLKEIRKTHGFDETCQGSVPEAITAFLESRNFEEAIRKAVWLRGDADTQADIAGAIAEAYYKEIPPEIEKETLTRLDARLRAKVMEWNAWLKERNKS